MPPGAIFPEKTAGKPETAIEDASLFETRMVAMCGIVGYTGAHQAAPILVAGLRRLEYRGYDSAGLATIDGDKLIVRKRAGRVRALEELLDSEPAPGICGISHTRWATHGPATDRNAHPHLGGQGRGGHGCARAQRRHREPRVACAASSNRRASRSSARPIPRSSPT